MGEQLKATIGVLGMGVMGTNLARNLARNGYRVAVYNRTFEETSQLIERYSHEGTFIPCHTLEEFSSRLERPRCVILMVKAGIATDNTIDALMDHLDAGDIIVDGGNSYYRDTIRREQEVSARGFHFVGSGISGGEYGALTGPSIMPGGSPESYAILGPMLEKISAHVDSEPCCAWIGPNGAGHFVKMIHNGIEYADMQVIGEAYELLKAAGITHAQAADIFSQWNSGELSSYLIEITADILRQSDPDTGSPLVDVIKERAGMKGTGTWTVMTALELGVPVNAIAESVFARAESSHDDLRAAARAHLQGPEQKISPSDRDSFIEDVRRALWASKVIAYSQGFDEIRSGGAEFGWQIDIADCAKIWRDGCIIRARLLDDISYEYTRNPHLVSLMCAPSIASQLADYQESLRRVVALAVQAGIPVCLFSSALSYYDMARAERNNAALTQAMRDYFGSHTYERIDQDGHFHLEWSTDRSQTKRTI